MILSRQLSTRTDLSPTIRIILLLVVEISFMCWEKKRCMKTGKSYLGVPVTVHVCGFIKSYKTQCVTHRIQQASCVLNIITIFHKHQKQNIMRFFKNMVTNTICGSSTLYFTASDRLNSRINTLVAFFAESRLFEYQ